MPRSILPLCLTLLLPALGAPKPAVAAPSRGSAAPAQRGGPARADSADPISAIPAAGTGARPPAVTARIPGSRPPLPYGVSPWLDAPLAAGLYAMKSNSGALLARTRAEHAWNPAALDRASVPFYDRWAIGGYSPRISALSSVVAGAELLAPLAVDLADGWKGSASWGALAVDAILLEETWMLSGSLSSYAKSLRVHSTPLSYDPAVPESEKRIPQNASSFFSNHTASAFATAVYSAYTFQARHPGSRLTPWMWGGSLGLASAVGAMRVMAGKHFPSDVVVGAAAGALCGYAVPRLHMGRSWNLGLTAPAGTSAVGPAVEHKF